MVKQDKTYFQIRLNLRGFDKDILSSTLFAGGCAGIEEFSDDIWFVYLTGARNKERMPVLLSELKSLNPALQTEQILVSTREEEDWNAEWKRHYQPIKIGKHVWVAPPWNKPHLRERDVLIQIDPQMAFGTGSHETTKLMVLAMEKYLHQGMSILDAGTGSGILAILAKKLGAGDVVGYDVESEAIDNARHNALLNKTKKINFILGDETVIPQRTFDLILANINLNVLIDLIPKLQKHMIKKGILILSGILRSDEQELRDLVKKQFRVLELFHKNEWLAMVLNKL